MEKGIKLAEISKCTGCSACGDVCPTDSITYEPLGFHFYPVINTNTCIKCRKCMQVCSPINFSLQNVANSDFATRYYCSWNKENQERYQATSGGVGGALAARALELGYYVCGAAFNNDWELFHIISNQSEIINKIRGSKYLQSSTEGVYKKIYILLKSGKNVLFLGTPCQTDALRKVIPLKYIDQLVTCEIICHGVNSPIVWSDFRKYIEKKYNSKLKYYNFRSKSRGWGKLRVSYGFYNGKEKDESGWKNIFHSWFGQHYIMRESCFHCQYRTVVRHSDIVIGDFWGIEGIEPDLDVKAGASVVIENSKKGRQFIHECKLNLFPIEEDKALSVLKGFVDKMPEDDKYSQIEKMRKFEEEYRNNTFENMALHRYPTISFCEKYFKSILYHLHFIK